MFINKRLKTLQNYKNYQNFDYIVIYILKVINMELEYYVSKFDTLESISKRFGVSVQEIKNLNNINSVLPEKLIIPNNQRNVVVVANLKREYVYIGNGEVVKNALAKCNLFCAHINNTINLFKPKNNDVYVVSVLDTLTSVCKKFGLTKDDVVKLNNLKTEKLFIGQILKLK